MNVGAICDSNALTVCASDTLGQAAQLMSNNYADVAVVVASRVSRPTAIGIVSYRDLFNSMKLVDLATLPILGVLDPNPLVLNEKEDFETAIAILRARGARHAPVVGSGGTLLGIVSLDRLLGCRAVHIGSRSAERATNTYR